MKGIYFIFNKKDKLIYIGQSEDIERRIKVHFSESENIMGKFSNIPIGESFRSESILVDDDKYRRWLERKLILILTPKYNNMSMPEVTKEEAIRISKILDKIDFGDVKL